MENKPLTPDHAEKIARAIEGHEVSIITAQGDGWLSPIERVWLASVIRRHVRTAVADRKYLDLLLEAQAELRIIASYADDPESNVGLRATAKAYRAMISRISAAVKDCHLSDARSAELSRIPTEAMIQAAIKAGPVQDNEIARITIRRMWQAMVEASTVAPTGGLSK